MKKEKPKCYVCGFNPYSLCQSPDSLEEREEKDCTTCEFYEDNFLESLI